MNEFILLLEILLPIFSGLPLLGKEFRQKTKDKMILYTAILFISLAILNMFAFSGNYSILPNEKLFQVSPSLRATSWILILFGFLFIYEIIVSNGSYTKVTSALSLLSGAFLLIYTSIPFTNSILIKKSLIHVILPFIGLETITVSSIGLYFSEKDTGIEALVKYLLTILISSSFIVMGISLFFTNINTQYILPVATAFLLTGISMEIGLVPFHMWLPDIAVGAPSYSIAYSILIGDTSLILFLTIFSVNLYKIIHISFIAIMVLLSLFSMSIGEISALTQKLPRRMLGYSIISDAGYIIIGIIAESILQMSDPWMISFFVITSNIAISSLYIILGSLEKDGKPIESTKLSGLFNRQPIAAILITLFFLSMAGIPPFAGFYAKLFILSYLMETFEYWLGYIAAFFFLVCVSYSLLIIFKAASEGDGPKIENKEIFIPLYISGIFLIIAGLWPDIFYILGGL